MTPSTANPVQRRAPLVDSNGQLPRTWIDYFNNLAAGNVVTQHVAAAGQTITAPNAGTDGKILVYIVTQGSAPASVLWDTNGGPTGSAAFVNAPTIPEAMNATYAAVFFGNSDDGKWYAPTITAYAGSQQIDTVLLTGSNYIAPPTSPVPPFLTVFLTQPSGGNGTIDWDPLFDGVSAYINPSAGTFSVFRFTFRTTNGLWTMDGQPTTGQL